MEAIKVKTNKNSKWSYNFKIMLKNSIYDIQIKNVVVLGDGV